MHKMHPLSDGPVSTGRELVVLQTVAAHPGITVNDMWKLDGGGVLNFEADCLAFRGYITVYAQEMAASKSSRELKTVFRQWLTVRGMARLKELAHA